MKSRLDQALEKYTKIKEEKIKTYKGREYQGMGYWATVQRTKTITVVKRPGYTETTIRKISQWDPSGNNKYLDWIFKTKLSTKLTLIDLKTFVTLFHQSPNKFKYKNIYDYKTTAAIEKELNIVPAKLSRSEQKKLGSDIIYECNKYKILYITTWEASKLYGYGTKWCISSRIYSCHFRDYRAVHNIYFVIFKDGDKLALTVRKPNLQIDQSYLFRIHGYNVFDNEMSGNILLLSYPKEIFVEVIKHTDKVTEDSESIRVWKNRLNYQS